MRTWFPGTDPPDLVGVGQSVQRMQRRVERADQVRVDRQPRSGESSMVRVAPAMSQWTDVRPTGWKSRAWRGHRSVDGSCGVHVSILCGGWGIAISAGTR